MALAPCVGFLVWYNLIPLQTAKRDWFLTCGGVNKTNIQVVLILS